MRWFMPHFRVTKRLSQSLPITIKAPRAAELQLNCYGTICFTEQRRVLTIVGGSFISLTRANTLPNLEAPQLKSTNLHNAALTRRPFSHLREGIGQTPCEGCAAAGVGRTSEPRAPKGHRQPPRCSGPCLDEGAGPVGPP